MKENYIASHVRREIKPDPIFVFSGKANAAIDAGKKNVINATIGALLNDDGQLALLPSVGEAQQRLSQARTSGYAPIAGFPEFRTDVIDYMYEDLQRPPINAIATAGGTGALRLAIWNFLETGDCFVTHDFFWDPYLNITEEAGRKLVTFKTFLPNGRFNVNGALEKTEEILQKQQRTMLLINTPGNNPTGVAIDHDEIVALRQGIITLAQKYPDKVLTLLIDCAYWEFGNGDNNKVLLESFQNLPENIVFCMAFTISKSLTRYGFRTGALIYSSANPDVVHYLGQILNGSVRAHWSNTNNLGQRLFSELYRDKQLLAQLKQEQKSFAELCHNRGQVFMKEADEVGLKYTPFQGGFFLTLPVDNSWEVCERLAERDMFFVPLSKGVRLALCAISEEQLEGLAGKIVQEFSKQPVTV